MLQHNLEPQFQEIYDGIISQLQKKELDDTKAALEIFLGLIKKSKADNSKLITVLDNLGNAFYQSEAFDAAEQCYRAAIPIAPENKGLTLLHCFIINCLIYQERLESAKAILAVALELVKVVPAPNLQCMENFKIIGDLFYDRNAFIEAEQCYQFAISLAPPKNKNLGDLHNQIANSISAQFNSKRSQEIENHYLAALKFAIANKEKVGIITVLKDIYQSPFKMRNLMH